MKQTGKRSAGNPHAAFDVAGAGNRLTDRLMRHSQRKRGATDRSALRSTAPVPDPTREMLEVRFLWPTRLDELQKRKNTTKSGVRAKVEHVFRVLKRQFGFDRVRFRGLARV